MTHPTEPAKKPSEPGSKTDPAAAALVQQLRRKQWITNSLLIWAGFATVLSVIACALNSGAGRLAPLITGIGFGMTVYYCVAALTILKNAPVTDLPREFAKATVQLRYAWWSVGLTFCLGIGCSIVVKVILPHWHS
ncbi:hypothetical protein [Oecophyllibacter saccharovorans]|uniref:hypothetical protein n=1 Tax=Oecophyllibacter saccharovorans TaxID=2558360 RepID=UPI001171AF9B|nr:hypothetical protein [Oecophyllibacter saccharovorans]TPW35061.1 hypothetical protein E3203_06170 [Oecophyllibacter saccharovorans]